MTTPALCLEFPCLLPLTALSIERDPAQCQTPMTPSGVANKVLIMHFLAIRSDCIIRFQFCFLQSEILCNNAAAM